MKQILFNTEMVKALLDNRKTTTRRLIKNISIHSKYIENSVYGPYNRYELYEVHNGFEDYDSFYSGPIEDISHEKAILDFAPYQIGDVIYVRETWNYNPLHEYGNEPDKYVFKASYDGHAGDFGWRPSLHMPKEIARIFLRVKDVRIEKLQDMKQEDALKEGLSLSCHRENDDCSAYTKCNFANSAACKDKFISLWNSTIKKVNLDQHGWSANPWVWVIEFEKI